MFERFTRSARAVVTGAVEEAERLMYGRVRVETRQIWLWDLLLLDMVLLEIPEL